MKCINCPVCNNFRIIVENRKTEHDVCVRMQNHIKWHSIQDVLNFVDEFWAEEYNKIYETLKE